MSHPRPGRRGRALIVALAASAIATLAGCAGPTPDDVTEPAAHEAPQQQAGHSPAAAPSRTPRPQHPTASPDADAAEPTVTAEPTPTDSPSGEDLDPSPTGLVTPTGAPGSPTPSGSPTPGTSPSGPIALPAATQSAGCPTPAKAVQHSAGRKGRTIALTFDDGPSPTSTAKVLAILSKHHVHATFFVVGLHAAEHPALLRAIEAQGSRLGNHSWSHPLPHSGGQFDKLPLVDEFAQIDRTQAAVKAAVGHVPCFFRAPGGMDKTKQSLAAARSRGLTVVNWDIDTRDWAAPHRPDVKAQASIKALATGHAAGGRTQPIVLFHDGAPGVYRGNMLSVLDAVITYYQQRGYTFTDPLGHGF